MNLNRKLLTVKEVADLTGLKESTIRKKIWLREIEYIKLGRNIRFCSGMIEEMIERCTIPIFEGRNLKAPQTRSSNPECKVDVESDIDYHPYRSRCAICGKTSIGNTDDWEVPELFCSRECELRHIENEARLPVPTNPVHGCNR
jgi:excisionase family DNA binding protein